MLSYLPVTGVSAWEVDKCFCCFSLQIWTLNCHSTFCFCSLRATCQGAWLVPWISPEASFIDVLLWQFLKNFLFTLSFCHRTCWSPGFSWLKSCLQSLSEHLFLFTPLKLIYVYTDCQIHYSSSLPVLPHLPAFHVFVVKVRLKSFHPFFASNHFCDVNCLVSEEQNIHKSIIKMLLKQCSQSRGHPSVWDWESSTKQP